MVTLPVSTVLIVGIAAASVLVYVPFLVVAYGRVQVGYDVARPRALFDKLPPYAQRATWAHQNSFEAFMLFAAAGLMAYVTQVDSTLAVTAVFAHLATRLLFSVFYILNIPILRSLMFGISSAGTATLMILSIQQLV